MTRLSELRVAALIYSLRSASIFTGLPEEELRRIASYAVLKTVRKGEYLFREHDPSIGFYVVRKGSTGDLRKKPWPMVFTKCSTASR